VATTGIGTGASIQIRAFLRKHGLTEKDYTEIETTYPGMKPMLVERKIDLGNFILPFLRQPDLNAVARPLFLQNEPFGPTEVLFIVSRAGFLQKNRPAMVDFLEDYVRVLRWYQDPANQERAVEIVAQYTKLPVNMLAGWLFTKQDYYRDPYGLVNLESLQKTMDAQKELGFIKTSPDVRQYADLSLVKEAAQGLK
jgi:NitT/TauT family transport system substrate-binding protein